MLQVSTDSPCYNNPAVLKETSEAGLFSESVKNTLQSEGILYLGQLCTLSEGKLSKFPDIGRKRLTEIKNVLEKNNLCLGVECTIPFRTAHDIQNFFCIDNISSHSEIFIDVSLPITLLKNLKDDWVVAAIQGTCQKAFEIAVTSDNSLDVSQLNSPFFHADIGLDTEQSPRGKLKHFSIPLKVPADLSLAHNDTDRLQRIADEISGVTLYPALKFILEPT